MSAQLFEGFDGVKVPRKPKPNLTERDMLDRLGRKFGNVKAGNGPRYVVADHVRSQAGHETRRTADFMAQDLWRSGHLDTHGFEVKVSRSDWLTELREPEKADEFRPYMNRWWLVVSDKSIVRDDLPEGWGLLVARGAGLSIAVQAPRQEATPMPVTMRAAFLRAAARTSQRRIIREVVAALGGDMSAIPHCERYLSPRGCLSTYVASPTPCPPCSLHDALTESEDA